MRNRGGLAVGYKKFRGSKYFLIILASFIASWVSLHFLTATFDPDWGSLNLILSIEASLGMGVFMMVSDRQDALQREQLSTMLHLLEAQRALLEALLPDHRPNGE